ncbi:TIM barrel protein [Candidatus Hodarchaeum mangrovi]
MFKIGLTIQKFGTTNPSSLVKFAAFIRLEHIEFDISVFDDIEAVIPVLKSKQTAIHAPYYEDYKLDLSSKNPELDSLIENIINYQKELEIIGVIVHPPVDPKGDLDLYYQRLDHLPVLPLLENMPHQPWNQFLLQFHTTQENISHSLGFCFDIPHSYITNEDQFLNLPDSLINLLKQNYGYIHISGGNKNKDTHFALLSEGEMPIPPIKTFLRKLPFKGTVTMELAPRNFNEIDKMLRSYSQMLGIAKKPLKKLENEIKRPFLMKKIRKFSSGS